VVTLMAFIEARLADDERLAQAITGKEWHEGSAWLRDMIHPLQSQLIDRPHFIPMITEEDIRHIARHDPARVLREVAAKRGLLERARRHQRWAETTPASAFKALATASQIMLSFMASVWSDHPDYLPEWAPERVAA
jgi:hypothetical protein